MCSSRPYLLVWILSAVVLGCGDGEQQGRFGPSGSQSLQSDSHVQQDGQQALGSTQEEEPEEQELGARLLKLEPSCGRFLSGFGDGESKVSPVMKKRMETSAESHSRWVSKVVWVTGEQFDTGFVLGGGLDPVDRALRSGLNPVGFGLAMAMEEISVGGNMTPEEFVACLLQKMSVLYDQQGNLNQEVAERLYLRMDTISYDKIAGWEASFEDVFGQDVNRFNVILSLVACDCLFVDERYDKKVAEKYRQRLGMLTEDEIGAWQDALPAFQKSGLDVPLGIVQVDELFPSETFDRAALKEALAAANRIVHQRIGEEPPPSSETTEASSPELASTSGGPQLEASGKGDADAATGGTVPESTSPPEESANASEKNTADEGNGIINTEPRVAAVANARPETFRTWTDSTGNHKTEAEFLKFENGVVWLKKMDGATQDVPLVRLSEVDQEWVRRNSPCDLQVTPGNSSEAEAGLSAKSSFPNMPPLRPGAKWRHPKTGCEMVFVPTSVIRVNSTGLLGADIPLGKDGVPAGCLVTARECPLFVTGFFVDALEVTNAAYARYLHATERKPPLTWPEGRYPAGEEEYPVSVSYEEASAYADWAGLRLPEVDECLAASAGEGGKYPWSADLEWNKDLNIEVGSPDSPVGANAKDISPFGVHDLLAHALEWTNAEVGIGGPMGNPLSGHALFFMKDLGEGLFHWASFAKERLPSAGFRCCYTPWLQILAQAKERRFDFSKRESYGYNIVKVSVVNESSRPIRFLSSSGLDEKVDAGKTNDVCLLAGTYLFTTPAVGEQAPSEVRFQVLAPERDSPSPWGSTYSTLTIHERAVEVVPPVPDTILGTFRLQANVVEDANLSPSSNSQSSESPESASTIENQHRIQHLIDALNNEQHSLKTREASAQKLGALGASEGIDALARYALAAPEDNTSQSLKVACVLALGQFDDRRADVVITEILKQKPTFSCFHEQTLYESAIRAAGKRRIPNSLELVAEIVDPHRFAPDPDNRNLYEAITEALAAFHWQSDKVLPILKRLMEHPNDNVPGAVIRTAPDCGPRGIQFTIAILDDQHSAYRATAISSLAAAGVAQAIPKIFALLDDEDQWIRGEAVDALVELDARDVVPKLIEMLSDSSCVVRVSAAEGLGTFYATEAAEALKRTIAEEALKGTPPGDAEWVRTTAREALSKVQRDCGFDNHEALIPILRRAKTATISVEGEEQPVVQRMLTNVLGYAQITVVEDGGDLSIDVDLTVDRIAETYVPKGAVDRTGAMTMESGASTHGRMRVSSGSVVANMKVDGAYAPPQTYQLGSAGNPDASALANSNLVCNWLEVLTRARGIEILRPIIDEHRMTLSVSSDWDGSFAAYKAVFPILAKSSDPLAREMLEDLHHDTQAPFAKSWAEKAAKEFRWAAKGTLSDSSGVDPNVNLKKRISNQEGPPVEATPTSSGFAPVAERQPTAGHVITHRTTGKQMVFVPTGFVGPNEASRSIIGSPTFTDDNEKVIGGLVCFGLWKRFVTGFHMDQTEVTNAEYLHYVQTAKASHPKSWNGKRPPEEKMRFPVSVTYAEAKEYADWAGLRLPYLYEYCASAANTAGVYPWRNDEIANTGKQFPVHSNKEDVSPLGIFDLAGNASEWGHETYSVEGKKCNLGFSFFYDVAGQNESWAAALLPDRQIGFRCVDDTATISSLGWATARRELEEVEGTTYSEVTMENTIDEAVAVMVSNGQSYQLPAKGRKTVDLPIGMYLATFRTASPAHQLMRIWRCQLHAAQFGSGKYGGEKYTWTLSENLGEAFPVKWKQ